ncbi:hypothetical protein J2X20_002955 [Pelomonas saccharophila]|uniref:DUF2846 domain-containing protein n=1 Tax=Roseateles saccharophilus TaxID=304 RepID=A0ABU1YN59_ROSSA|nr:hypothetical protein [Roseateles saccharophilus]MDR7270297.1 hypothetical protein [Roseateles saccharophilus]
MNLSLSIRLWAAVLLLLGLAGCATPNIDAKHDVRGATTTGVVSGSITYAGPYGLYRLRFVSQETGEKYPVEHGSGQTLNPVLAFKGEDPHPGLKKRGSPFAVALPAGNYELKGWELHCGNAHLASSAATGVVFKVEPGQAIYLGNFNFVETARFVRMPTAAALSLSEQSARDLPVIRTAFPALAEVPITQTLNPAARLENLGGQSASRIDIPIFIPVVR